MRLSNDVNAISPHKSTWRGVHTRFRRGRQTATPASQAKIVVSNGAHDHNTPPCDSHRVPVRKRECTPTVTGVAVTQAQPLTVPKRRALTIVFYTSKTPPKLTTQANFGACDTLRLPTALYFHTTLYQHHTLVTATEHKCQVTVVCASLMRASQLLQLSACEAVPLDTTFLHDTRVNNS